MQQSTNVTRLTHFYIPSIQKLISRRQYLDIYKKCKDCPGIRVDRTICNWWGGTTDDVIREIQNGIDDRINSRISNR